MLNASNRRFRRISSGRFEMKRLSDFFRPVDIYKLNLNKIKELNFIRFPFLLSLDFKYKLLQVESVYEQQVNVQKNLRLGLQNMFNQGII